LISIHVLGAPVVRRAEGPTSGRAAHRRRLALLAILAAARGRPVGRERIIGLLWAESSGDAARHSCSEALYVLRKDLGEECFVVIGDEVGLDPAHAHSDLDDFELAMAEGRWEDAFRAYGGPFLDGFYVSDAPEFERWVDGERDRLARACGRALEELATAAEAEGQLLRAAEWWRRLLAHDAFSSRVALRLVRVLERAGERAAALRAAEAHVLLLREELGVAPDAELTALMDDLRREPPAPPPRSATPAADAVVPAAGRVEEDAGPRAAADAVAVAAVPAADGGGEGEIAADVNAPAAPPLSVEPRRRRRRLGGWVAAGVAAVAAMVVLAALMAGRDPAAQPQYDPRRIAVLYLDDDSPRGDLQYLANGLTEMLIHELSQVQQLEVISRNGVKPYRDGTVTFDSIVAQLRVGSVVEGSVQRSADSVRVVVQLIDGNTGAHLESKVIVRPLDDLFQVQGAVSDEVSGFLRRQLGARIRQHEAVAETRSPRALDLTLRGEQAFADALELRNSQDTADVGSALRTLAQAETLLSQAEREDGRWTRPTVARAWVALREAQWSEGMARTAAFDRAVELAERVLAREPANARALEARGTTLWIRSMDPGGELAPLRAAGERDLRAALAAEPELASAWGTLSFLLYTRGELVASAQAAERALEYDAWLEGADNLLSRRFYSLLTTGEYRAAREACDRGRRTFPRDVRFVECQLTLLRYDDTRPPDPVLAWRLVAQLDAMDPPAAAAAAGRGYSSVFRRMAAASVSARAGDAERARAELSRARLQAAPDAAMRTSLAFDEAVILLLLGDRPAARERLEVYLAQSPGARATVARDPLVRTLLATSAPSAESAQGSR
jgi:DNA-binding SARP family transcriptional activator/TolB-like protein